MLLVNLFENFTAIVITFLPVFLTIIFLLMVLRRIDSGLLKEDGTVVVMNKDGNAVQESKASSSRFILMLSGITAISIGLAITCYAIYVNALCPGECEEIVSMDDIASIILSLGIGVVPYAFNQVKKGMSPANTNNQNNNAQPNTQPQPPATPN